MERRKDQTLVWEHREVHTKVLSSGHARSRSEAMNLEESQFVSSPAMFCWVGSGIEEMGSWI